MFSRVFMHLKNQEAKTACMLPKLVGDRYPTSRYSVFAVKSVSGQICGQKFFAETHGGGKARKREENGDFASFRRSAHEAVTRSQAGALLTALHPVCGWLLLQINSEQSILYLICAAKSIGAEDFFKLCITKKPTNVTLRSESPRYSLKSRICETAYPRRWTACEPFLKNVTEISDYFG